MPFWRRTEKRLENLLSSGEKDGGWAEQVASLLPQVRDADLALRAVRALIRSGFAREAERALEEMERRGLGTDMLRAEVALATGRYREALSLSEGRTGLLWLSIRIRALDRVGPGDALAEFRKAEKSLPEADLMALSEEVMEQCSSEELLIEAAKHLLEERPKLVVERLRNVKGPRAAALRGLAKRALGDLEGALDDLLEAASSGDPEWLLEAGKVALRLGREDIAEGALRRAAEQNVEEAARMLGEILLRSGRMEEAARFLARAGKEGVVRASQILLDLGKYEDALKVIEGIPESAEILRIKAIALYGLGRIEEALAKADAYLLIHEDPDVLRLKADILGKMGNREELGRTLIRLGEKLGDAEAIAKGATLLAESGSWEEGVAALKLSISKGLDRGLYDSLFSILSGRGRWGEIVEYYPKEGLPRSSLAFIIYAEALAREKGDFSELEALSREGNPEAMLRLARLLLERGEIGRAMELLRETCKVSPSWESYMAFGESLEKAGRYQEAVAALRASLSFRDDPKTRAKIARLLILLGDLDGAEREAVSILDTEADVEAKKILARCNLARKDFRKSAAILEELRNLGECDKECITMLGEAYRRMGSEEKALEVLEGAEELDAEGYRVLAEIYVRRGMWVQALLAYSRLEGREPLRPRDLALRGIAEEGVGRVEDAIKDFSEAIKRGLRDQWVVDRLVEAMYKGGDWEGLVGILKNMRLEGRPLLLLARALAEKGDTGTARRIAEGAFSKDLDSEKELVLGRIDEIEGKLESALARYRRSGSPESMARASAIYARMGNIFGALEAARSATGFFDIVGEVACSLAASPLLPELLPRLRDPRTRARALALMGRCEDAEGELGIGQTPPVELALCYLLRGRRRRAFDISLDIISRGVKIGEASQIAIISARGSEDMTNAILKRLKKMRDPEAYLSLARIYARRGKYKSSLKMAERRLKFGPDIRAMAIWVESLLNLEHFKAAYRAAERMLSLDPDSREAAIMRDLARSRTPLRVFEAEGSIVGPLDAVPDPGPRSPGGLPVGELPQLEREGFLLAQISDVEEIPNIGEVLRALDGMPLSESLRVLSYIEGVDELRVGGTFQCRLLPRAGEVPEGLLEASRALRCGPLLAKLYIECRGRRGKIKVERVSPPAFEEGQEEEL